VPERLKSIFIDTKGPTLNVKMVSLHAEDDVDERPQEIVGDGFRYEDLSVLGVGGMGEVRRVRERDLNRTLAMKIIKPEVMKKTSSLARFIEEAQVSAQLQHPSIIPVHEIGRLHDGRYYFTMQEIRGRELGDAITSVHAASTNGRWDIDVEGWGLRQLITALQRACQAVGYAHARGVIHRDLKPSNIMVGRDGEVFVVDWGIAKIRGRDVRTEDDGMHDLDWIETNRSGDASQSTRAGAVTGTPAYMSPEQARGDVALVSMGSDVYALGAILYKILTGRVPYLGKHLWQLLMAVAKADLKPPSEVTARKIPDELEDICVRALSAHPDDRYRDARALADALGAWLDGAKRRERALELVRRAHDAKRDAEDMLQRAVLRQREGEAWLEKVPSWAPEGDKHGGWALEDEAKELTQDARLKGLQASQALYAALTYVPELPEAHEALAEHHHEQHQQAEGERDATRAEGEAIILRTHMTALPDGEMKQGLATYLKGVGALTLVTEPDEAEVHLYRFVKRHRRLVPQLVRSLGRTPLIEVPLDRGSYLLELRSEDRDVVRYPVLIERRQCWDGVRPGDDAPYPIVLPEQDSLGPYACYVPAGWFWMGGDPQTRAGWSRRRYWADAFVMQRFSVTNRQYIAFLDELVTQGREEDALLYVPRERGGTAGQEGTIIYGRDAEGRFVLRPDADGDMWLADEPVSMVNWHCAKAYATWFSEHTGNTWRLAMEQEWEKSARGADGRFFPWGDVHDPSWCCMKDSHRGQMLPHVVDSYPVDVSVYGVRGLSGNIREWCEDTHRASEPSSALVDTSAMPREGTYRVTRGGAWNGTALFCRAASRSLLVPSFRGASLGLRIVRSYP